jgi:hypothetical protein
VRPQRSPEEQAQFKTDWLGSKDQFQTVEDGSKPRDALPATKSAQRATNIVLFVADNEIWEDRAGAKHLSVSAAFRSGACGASEQHCQL